jgi:hypothetical protein
MMSNTQKISRIVFAACLALILVGMMVATMRVSAAPDLIPTPVTNPGARSASVLAPVNFYRSVAVTADGRGQIYNLSAYNILDVQYVIDQGTTNTITLKVQYSCDGVNWSDGPTIASAKAADTSDILQVNNYCRYTNIYADVANTNPVTITVVGVAK